MSARPSFIAGEASRLVLTTLLLTSLALPASADGGDSPTGPIELPVTGVALDPLAPGERERVELKDQPNPANLPIFVDSPPSAPGWFGQGFARPSAGSQTIRRVAVATGNGKVFVAAGGPRRVYVFDARTLTQLASFGPSGIAGGAGETWQSLSSIAWWRGELFVLGKASNQTRVRVYDESGAHLRTLAALPSNLGTFAGMDAAWGELWLTTSSGGESADREGQQVLVLDARSGAVKGISRQPLSDTAASSPVRRWWDVSIAPEVGGAIVDMRLFKRGELAPGLPLGDSPLCTAAAYYVCTSQSQAGTDAAWGMRWFLELPSATEPSTYRPVREYSIERRKTVVDATLIRQLLGGAITLEHPGYYLTPKRTWVTQQQLQGDTPTLSDIAYNAREARIDWWGYLTRSEWLRGQQKCLGYAVSKADIFVLGDRGERWLEPIDGLQSVRLYVDGQLRDQDDPAPANATGELCLDTTQLQDGAHKLSVEATLADGRKLTKENPELRVDNAPPRPSLDPVGQYSTGTVQLTGTVSDGPSGLRESAVEVLASGADPQTGWRKVCSDPALDPIGRFSCAWDTSANTNGQRVYPDGTYGVRLRARDRSSDTASLEATPDTTDDGNTATTPQQTTVVDNTPPQLSDPAPAVGSDFASDGFHWQEVDSVYLTQTDALSGMDSTRLEYNTATDGSGDGQWAAAQAAALLGDGEAQTTWDTSEVPDGLHRVRGIARDRAGNERTAEWQVVFSSRRRRCPGGRCYGGLALFDGQRRDGDGLRGRIELPGFVPQGRGFTANSFGLHGTNNRTVEGGTINNNCPEDPKKERADAWFLFATFQKPTGFLETFPCFQRLGASEEKGAEVVTNNKGYAHVELGGRVRAIVKHRKRYKIGHGDGTVAFGETDHYGREIGGSFKDVDMLSKDGGWRDPSNESKIVDQGARYESKYRNGDKSTGYFCVHGPNRGCSPP